MYASEFAWLTFYAEYNGVDGHVTFELTVQEKNNSMLNFTGKA
jgi:NTP pyrophosphatase (non-canonical NTP hydrolase)